MSWLRRGAAFVLSATVLPLAACSGGASPPSPKVLKVIMTNDWAGTPPVLDAVKEFERTHPGVRVDIQGPIIENVSAAVRAQIAQGNPPDVVQWHAFAAGAQGFAEELDDLWKDRLRADEFLVGAVEDVEWAGHMYGVPLDTNAMLLIYNVPRFRAADADPRRIHTFADLERQAAAVTSRDGTQRAIALPSSTWATYGWFRANGGEIIEVGPDGKPRFTFDRKENVEALAYLARLVRKGYAFPPVGRLGDRIDAYALFRSGITALHASGSWDLAALEREGVGASYAVALMPRGVTGTEGGTVMGGSSLFVPKGAKNRKLAFDFMLQLISDPYALRLANEEGRLPVRLRVYEDPSFDEPALRTFLDQLTSARPFMLEAFPSQHAIFRDALTDVLQGRKGARPALEEVQRRVEQLAP